MIKFSFLARKGDETVPLTVQLEYQPGNQTQRARRLAVGELLAVLQVEQAAVDASGQERVLVTVGTDTWVIAESQAAGGGRGSI